MSTEDVKNSSDPMKGMDLLKRQKLLRNVTDDVIEQTSRHIRAKGEAELQFRKKVLGDDNDLGRKFS
jgi:CRP/FNR family transcriptional regulator, cyclic AMP receptor protein